MGKTSVIVNLASALAQNGQRVLLIDENPCHNNICTSFGIKARFDLLHVIHRDKSLDQVILRGPDNISILSAMRGIQALSKLDPLEQNWLIKSFSELADTVDIVLIDTAMTGTTHVLPLSLASEQILIVISGSAASLTGAYALIKIMSQEYSRQHFLILVNKVDSETESLAIYQNLFKVVRRFPHHLNMSVIYQMIKANQSTIEISISIFPNSQASTCFKYIAQNILRSACPDRYDGGVDDFMQRLIRTSLLSMDNFTV